MIYKIALLLILLLSGCSIKTPVNEWEYKSTGAFNSYTKHFLTNKDILAQDDLEKALEYAKQSANLEQLARITLGVCALKLSVGIDDKCREYKNIKEIISSKELNSYYQMLQNSLKEEEIQNLPSQYQNFISFKQSANYEEAFKAIQNIDQTTSKFIAATFIKEKLTKEQINYLLDIASYHGYKKLVIFWLKQLSYLESDTMQKELIKKKIYILENE